MNDDLNFNFNDLSKHTPNRNNISISRFGTPLNYSNEPFPNSFLNESNGVKLTNITNENILRTRFDSQEDSIKSVCVYYISLKNIFNEADIDIKNKLLQYVTEFNNSCKNFLDKKTNNYIEAKRYSEEKNKLKENLNQKTEEYNNMEKKYRQEKEELKESMRKEIQDLKFRLKDAEDKNKKFKVKIEESENKIREMNQKIYSLREEFKTLDQPAAQDYINISYCLGEQTENLNIDIATVNKKELDLFTPKIEMAKKNFNNYAKLLVETSNNAYEQFKNIYHKIKGKEWFDSNNSLIKVYYYETYNIDEELSWSNITRIHQTLNAIINEIVELVNPTKNCDSKKLNEDSCEFLLNYIEGLKKLFFLQKEVIDNGMDIDNEIEMRDWTGDKNKILNMKKNTEEIEKFFAKNGDVMRNDSYFEKFRKQLSVENTQNMMVDEYIKTITEIYSEAKYIAEQGENEFIRNRKSLEGKSKRAKYDDVELISNNKNKNPDFDNIDLE